MQIVVTCNWLLKMTHHIKYFRVYQNEEDELGAHKDLLGPLFRVVRSHQYDVKSWTEITGDNSARKLQSLPLAHYNYHCKKYLTSAIYDDLGLM